MARILGHDAHAPGHAALLIGELGVLIASDMVSDVWVPLLDRTGAVDPVADHLAASQMLESVSDAVQVLIPGHGSIGKAGQMSTRIGQDRAYLQALGTGHDVIDGRLGASARPGWEWVTDVHQHQALAQGSGAGWGRRIAGNGTARPANQ